MVCPVFDYLCLIYYFCLYYGEAKIKRISGICGPSLSSHQCKHSSLWNICTIAQLDVDICGTGCKIIFAIMDLFKDDRICFSPQLFMAGCDKRFQSYLPFGQLIIRSTYPNALWKWLVVLSFTWKIWSPLVLHTGKCESLLVPRHLTYALHFCRTLYGGETGCSYEILINDESPWIGSTSVSISFSLYGSCIVY